MKVFVIFGRQSLWICNIT